MSAKRDTEERSVEMVAAGLRLLGDHDLANRLEATQKARIAALDERYALGEPRPKTSSDRMAVGE